MNRISITRIQNQQEASSVLREETQQHFENIRQLAFAFFEQRGHYLGDDLGDWFRAERAVVWKPHAEMFENDSAIVLRMAVPGFDEKSIRLIAAPYMLAIQATDTHRHYGLQARLRFCEFGERLFRSFELSVRIDPKKVSATLDRGIIEVVASKARQQASDPDLAELASAGAWTAAAK